MLSTYVVAHNHSNRKLSESQIQGALEVLSTTGRINDAKEFGHGVLFQSCVDGDQIVALAILQNPNIDVNQRDKYTGRTPLMAACIAGSMECLYALCLFNRQRPGVLLFSLQDDHGYSALSHLSTSDRGDSQIMAYMLVVAAGQDLDYANTGLLPEGGANSESVAKIVGLGRQNSFDGFIYALASLRHHWLLLRGKTSGDFVWKCGYPPYVNAATQFFDPFVAWTPAEKLRTMDA